MPMPGGIPIPMFIPIFIPGGGMPYPPPNPPMPFMPPMLPCPPIPGGIPICPPPPLLLFPGCGPPPPPSTLGCWTVPPKPTMSISEPSFLPFLLPSLLSPSPSFAFPFPSAPFAPAANPDDGSGGAPFPLDIFFGGFYVLRVITRGFDFVVDVVMVVAVVVVVAGRMQVNPRQIPSSGGERERQPGRPSPEPSNGKKKEGTTAAG